MNIQVSKAEGKILVAFDEADMRLKDRFGDPIWEDAKEAIKERFPKNERAWDPDRKCWVIDDTESNRRGVEAINRLYFKHQNQTELF